MGARSGSDRYGRYVVEVCDLGSADRCVDRDVGRLVADGVLSRGLAAAAGVGGVTGCAVDDRHAGRVVALGVDDGVDGVSPRVCGSQQGGPKRQRVEHAGVEDDDADPSPA